MIVCSPGVLVPFAFRVRLRAWGSGPLPLLWGSRVSPSLASGFSGGSCVSASASSILSCDLLNWPHAGVAPSASSCLLFALPTAVAPSICPFHLLLFRHVLESATSHVYSEVRPSFVSPCRLKTHASLEARRRTIYLSVSPAFVSTRARVSLLS